MVKLVIRFLVTGLLMEAGAAYAMGGDPWFHTQGSNYSLENFGLRSYFLGERNDYVGLAPNAEREFRADRRLIETPPTDQRRGSH